MARVFPSQIVALINRHPPEPNDAPTHSVNHASAAILTAIARLVDEVPTELLTISGIDYDDLVCGVEAIRNGVAFWQSARVGQIGLLDIRGRHPLLLIRNALEKCPDEAPSAVITELAFILDDGLRDSIRLDMSSATAALHNGESKAATVLAGSAAEALLLWAISQSPGLANVEKPRGSPEQWTLGEYIGVARALNLIKDATAQQVALAKDFRNLIHPGRAQRLGETCDRATALTALAAVELIARDLS